MTTPADLPILAAALEYCRCGWSVLPLCPPVCTRHQSCGTPGKRPWIRWKQYEDKRPIEGQLEGWWRVCPESNVGIALGPVSRLVRVDVDSEEGEAKLLELSGGDLPTTLEFTSGKGRGVLYRIPDGMGDKLKTTPFRGGDRKESVRFQAKGAQTVLPPSRHPSGRVYTWIHGPGDIEPALMPSWLVEALTIKPVAAAASSNGSRRHLAQNKVIDRAVKYIASCTPAVSGCGGHNQTMAVARAIVHGFDLGPEIGYDLLAAHYNPRCQPPWSEAELRHKCKDANEKPFDKPRGWLLEEQTTGFSRRAGKLSGGKEDCLSGGTSAPSEIHLTDVGNGKRLIGRHGKILRCCLPWGKWLSWDGQRWEVDAAGRVVALAKETVLSLFSGGRSQVQEIEKQLKEIPDDEPDA